jgi:lysophospholipase L1-like esterase
MPRGRLLLALAVVAVALSGTLIGRALRQGAPTCATSSVTPTAVLVGDSMSTVTAPAGPNIAFPLVAARLLGWQVKVDAHPDTGFTTPDGQDAQHPSFAARVGCVIAAHPRIVIVALGSDDAEVADPARMVGLRATKGLAELQRRLPRAQVVVVGPLPSGGTPSPALQTVRDAVRAAAQAAHLEFIDPIAEAWITGERTDPGSGNVNRMISTDGRHLTPAGHAYVGLRLATDLSRLGPASR